MPTTGRNYSGEQRVNFESPVPFSKCLRAKIYNNMNVYIDAQGCQTLLLKESDPLLFCLGSCLFSKDEITCISTCMNLFALDDVAL